MYVPTPKKPAALVVTLVPAKQRALFVGRLRNGGGVHQDKRRRNDRADVKARLRRGDW